VVVIVGAFAGLGAAAIPKLKALDTDPSGFSTVTLALPGAAMEFAATAACKSWVSM
jgi:hypothetical protein